MRISYTIYPEAGKPPRVGITFPPTPSLTLEEVDQLIEQMQKIVSEMEALVP